MATLQKDGTLYIPQWFLRSHGLQRGQRFELSMKGNKIVLKPLKNMEEQE